MENLTKDRQENSAIKSSLYSFPKIELHRHLEGTFPIKSLYNLSVKNELDTPKDFNEFKKAFQFPKDSKPDFLLFLSKFKNFWYRSLDDVSSITYDSVKELKEDGLHYIELRFSPEHFSLFNNFNRTETANTVIEACNTAAREIGIKIKYILTFNRTNQTSEEMLKTYKSFKHLIFDDIVGIDLAGDEINYPPELFKSFFDYIYEEKRLKIDIHAGEVCDSTNIWTSIKELHADRIGHGISSIHDQNLLNYLKEHQISMCQCITSNYQTGAWVDQNSHPLAKVYRQNIPVNISSDDPSIQDTSLTEDYIKLWDLFGFTIEDFKDINLKSIDYSFLTESEKKSLKRSYKRSIKSFQ